jgi:drug/metabolite transporter (DMT)-like permease
LRTSSFPSTVWKKAELSLLHGSRTWLSNIGVRIGQAMTRQNKAYVFAALAVLCWSTVASAFKLTLLRVDYLTLLFYSSAVSTVFLLAALLVQGKGHLLLETAGLRKQSQGRSAAAGATNPRHALLRSAANGLLNPFLYYVVLFKAYSLLPAQEAQPLNYTWPLMLVLLSAPLLGEKIRPLSILALAISFFGVLIVSTHGDLTGLRFTNLPGAILAVGSAVLWALFWLVNVRDDRDEVLKLLLNFFFGFLYVLITVLVLSRLGLAGDGGHTVENPVGTGGLTQAAEAGWARSFPPRADAAGLAGCAYAGIFEMGLAFVLWLKALRFSEGTARVSNLIFLSPFVSLIFIRFVVGETILPSSIVGLGFIACGILIQRTVSRNPRTTLKKRAIETQAETER